MKLSTFLTVKAIVCFLFGIGYAVVPITVGSIYAINLDPDGILMARFFAALLIGVGLILWLLRNADWNVLKIIILSLCIADTIGFITALVAQLTGVTNALGWIIVAIWFLLALGLGYFRFLKPIKA
jgi:ABC-type transport system involved in multi-copper enzyme maturation permease subunit